MIVMSIEKTTAPFAKLEHELIDSEAYRALSMTARATLVELCRLHNGRNNGEIAAPARWLGERLGCHQTTASAALRELIGLGFVRVETPSDYNAKNRPAVYALTCYPCGDKPATKDYLSAQPELRMRRKTHLPEALTLRPEAPTLHDRSAHASRRGYRSARASMPEAPALQSIDLAKRSELSTLTTPSAQPAESEGSGKVRAGLSAGAVPTSEPPAAGPSTLLAGHFTLGDAAACVSAGASASAGAATGEPTPAGAEPAAPAGRFPSPAVAPAAGPAPVAAPSGCPAGIDPEAYRVMRASAMRAPIVRGDWDREKRAAAVLRATNDGCGRHSLGVRPASPHRAPAVA